MSHASNFEVALVTYNSSHLIGETLNNLTELPIAIFDNASTDNTVAVCKKLRAGLRIVQSQKNIGYGRAVNEIVSTSFADYVLVLNPDVDCSTQAAKALYEKAAALSGDWLYIVPNSGHPPTLKQHGTNLLGLAEIQSATGCAILFNVEIFKALGGFDPKIFLYYEEMDLSKRAKKANVPMFYAAEIETPHYSKKSTATTATIEYMRDWHFRWSSLYFYCKHKCYAKLVTLVIKNLLITPFRYGFSESTSKSEMSTKISATLHFISGRGAFRNNGNARFSPLATDHKP